MQLDRGDLTPVQNLKLFQKALERKQALYIEGTNHPDKNTVTRKAGGTGFNLSSPGENWQHSSNPRLQTSNNLLHQE